MLGLLVLSKVIGHIFFGNPKRCRLANLRNVTTLWLLLERRLAGWTSVWVVVNGPAETVFMEQVATSEIQVKRGRVIFVSHIQGNCFRVLSYFFAKSV